jgi:hypothetical protein
MPNLKLLFLLTCYPSCQHELFHIATTSVTIRNKGHYLSGYHQKEFDPDIQAAGEECHGDGIHPGRILSLKELVVKTFSRF